MSITEGLLPDFLTQEEAAAELKVCKRTLDRWRRLGEGPPITRLGRRILFRRSSSQAWLRARERHAHSDDDTDEKSSGLQRRSIT
jgi:hypothetical protein